MESSLTRDQTYVPSLAGRFLPLYHQGNSQAMLYWGPCYSSGEQEEATCSLAPHLWIHHSIHAEPVLSLGCSQPMTVPGRITRCGSLLPCSLLAWLRLQNFHSGQTCPVIWRLSMPALLPCPFYSSETLPPVNISYTSDSTLASPLQRT